MVFHHSETEREKNPIPEVYFASLMVSAPTYDPRKMVREPSPTGCSNFENNFHNFAGVCLLLPSSGGLVFRAIMISGNDQVA